MFTQKGSIEIDRYLVFRNTLRLNAQLRKEYENVKRKLAAQDWENMNEYANAKTKVVEKIIAIGFDNLDSN